MGANAGRTTHGVCLRLCTNRRAAPDRSLHFADRTVPDFVSPRRRDRNDPAGPRHQPDGRDAMGRRRQRRLLSSADFTAQSGPPSCPRSGLHRRARGRLPPAHRDAPSADRSERVDAGFAADPACLSRNLWGTENRRERPRVDGAHAACHSSRSSTRLAGPSLAPGHFSQRHHDRLHEIRRRRPVAGLGRKCRCCGRQPGRPHPGSPRKRAIQRLPANRRPVLFARNRGSITRRSTSWRFR